MDADALRLVYGISVLTFALTTLSLGRALRHLTGWWRWPAAGGLFLVTFVFSAAFPTVVAGVVAGNVCGAAASVLLIQAFSALGERRVPQWPWGLAIVGSALNAWFGLVAQDFTVRAEVVNAVSIVLFSTLAWETFHTRVASERRPMRAAAIIFGFVVASYVWRAIDVAINPQPTATGFSVATLVFVLITATAAFFAMSVVLALVIRRREAARRRAAREAEAAAREAELTGSWAGLEGVLAEPDIAASLEAEIQVATLSGRPLTVLLVHPRGMASADAGRRAVEAVNAMTVSRGCSVQAAGEYAEGSLLFVIPGVPADEAAACCEHLERELADDGTGMAVAVETFNAGSSSSDFRTSIEAAQARICAN
jgi:hypothetical protein